RAAVAFGQKQERRSASRISASDLVRSHTLNGHAKRAAKNPFSMNERQLIGASSGRARLKRFATSFSPAVGGQEIEQLVKLRTADRRQATAQPMRSLPWCA